MRPQRMINVASFPQFAPPDRKANHFARFGGA